MMAIVDKGLPPVELCWDQEIGLGAYGKVFKAKIGHLPCAAKLLHDTLSSNNSDPGRFQFAERFEKECEVLSTIKHPNIVQYLGTTRDAQSQRLVLLMELMDKNLTKFLEQSPDHVPYHIQVNICHDVALALSFLHSKNIIHRDLSSNNVLLFNESSRAKISDFGMAKFSDDMKASMATTTICPGTTVYMPPEARISPPHYSNKLDCFSHGVLTIQILTKNFPSPGVAHTYHMDPQLGRIVIERQETERRKKDIELMPDHPLLPIALNCLNNIDAARPSADDICKDLEELKKKDCYIISEQQFKGQAILNLKLKEELQVKETIIKMEKANYQREIEEKERAHEKEKSGFQKDVKTRERIIEQFAKDQHKLMRGSVRSRRGSKRLQAGETSMSDPTELEWIRGKHAPKHFESGQGTSAVNDNTAYFSCENRVYSYTLSNNQWNKLPLSQFKLFSMAIISNQLTTIGGCQEHEVTNALMTYQPHHIFRKKWMEVFPPMNIGRIRPSVVVTRTNNLVVAGGQESTSNPRGLLDVEVLDIDSCEWFVAENLPLPIHSLQMTECGRHIYILKNTSFYSCSTSGLLKSCRIAGDGDRSVCDPVWEKASNLPLQSGASLVTLGENVVTLGGHTTGEGYPSGIVEYYNVATKSWQVLGQLPSVKSRPLPAVLPSRRLIVTGGFKNGDKCRDTNIGSILVILNKDFTNSLELSTEVACSKV